MKLAIFTDYDGTITKQDTVDLVLDTYGAPDWQETSHRLDAAGTTNIERMSAEFEGLHASRKEVASLVREKVEIDQTFKDFLSLASSRGWRVVVLSQGMGQSVATIFDKYDIRGLEWHANALSGPDGDLSIDFVERGSITDDECHDLCGVCKSGHIRQAKRDGFTTVYIGDGITDRCPSQTADVVFAKRYLKKYLTEKGLDFTAFDAFSEVADRLEEMFPA